MPLLVLQPFFSQCMAQSHHLNSISFSRDDLVPAMPPIQRLWRFLVFLEADGQNHRVWKQSRHLFYVQHSRNLSRALDALQSPFFFQTKKENQNFPQMKIIWHKNSHFHTVKSIWCQKKITDASKRFIYHISKLGSWILGTLKSTIPFCWSHLLTNSRNLVAHLIDHWQSSRSDRG